MVRKPLCLRKGGLLPHVDCSHCELHSFQPQNHEEPLAERTVPHVFTIVSSLEGLKKKKNNLIFVIAQPADRAW